MEDLKIEATKSSPHIFFDKEKNTLEIRGSSYPPNIEDFYSPVFFWLEKYLDQLQLDEFIVNMELLYFNSGSSIVFESFFDKLLEAVNRGKSISINWIYEEDDEDALEFGEEFQEDFENLKFNFIKKSSANCVLDA
jgi:hypothetical protein